MKIWPTRRWQRGGGEMTEESQKQRLHKVLMDYAHVHCNGCDEWMCEHLVDEDKNLLERMVDDVWQEIISWPKEE